MPEASRQPTYMRYARVQQVLEQEPAFVARMGGKTEVVLKPDGEKQLFSPEVIQVTQVIHDGGKDAHKVHKTEIIRTAVNVFRIRKDASANGAVHPAPAPEPPPAPAPAPAKPVVAEKPEKPKAPVASSKPPQKAAPKPPAKAKASPPAAVPTPKEAPAAPASAAPAEVDTSKEAAIAQAKAALPQPRPGDNAAAYNAFISIYSLLLTALQLTELYDNQPGREKRYKTIDDLAHEVNKFTSIKSAKESQKT